MTEVTKKGTLRIVQVACVEIDLDEHGGNVFSINGSNKSVTSLEDIVNYIKTDGQFLWEFVDPAFDITEVSIIDPDTQAEVDRLRKQAQEAMAAANKLIKG
jgi:hypothetical protein